MDDAIIKVDNLSKAYRIGMHEQASDSLAASILAGIKSPFRNLRKLRNLTTFDNETDADIFWALKDVSFELKQGDVLGVIGKNGAGKSTLLKLLSRITPPSHGKISINGRVASLLEVGTGFHNELTGRENVYMNGTILGMKRKEIDRKFDEIVEFSGVEKFIDTPVKRYSSGMKVRLAFAVAANLEPEILIIDEVLAVGDSEFQKKCLGKMDDISHQGRTILFVSHNMSAVKSLCNKALLLRNGKLVVKGEVQDVIDSYLDQEFSNISIRAWEPAEAPGNESVRLLKAELLPVNSNNDVVITLQTAIKVVFEFEMLEDDFRLHISLLLYKSDGDVIFTTFSQVTRAEKRVYRAECMVPGNLLNDGNYFFELCLVKNRNNLLYKFSEILVFDVIDIDRGENNSFAKINGVIRPQLEWKFPV